MSRPTGVTVLAMLELVVGIFALSGGALIFAGTALAALADPVSLGAVAVLLGVLFLGLGLISLIIAFGFRSGKGWAWTTGLVLAIIGILTSLGTLVMGTAGSIVGLVLNLIIIYYLTRGHVKTFFRKGSTGSSSQP